MLALKICLNQHLRSGICLVLAGIKSACRFLEEVLDRLASALLRAYLRKVFELGRRADVHVLDCDVLDSYLVGDVLVWRRLLLDSGEAVRVGGLLYTHSAVVGIRELKVRLVLLVPCELSARLGSVCVLDLDACLILLQLPI